MRFLLLTLMLALIVVVVCLAWSKPDLQPNIYNHIIDNKGKIVDRKIISDINKNCLNTFSSYVDVKIIKGREYYLSGTVKFAQPNKFDLTLNGITPELIIGSNDKMFWFWSKRDKNPALYYALHEDLHKTRLKSPFDPNWLLGCMNLSIINDKDTTIEKGDYYIISQNQISPNNKPIVVKTITNDKVCFAKYIYDQDKLTVSSEIQEFQNVNGYLVPKRIIMNWYDENVQLQWHFYSTNVNVTLNNSWQMPNIYPQIDMSKD